MADDLLNDRVALYVEVLNDRYQSYLEMFFPQVAGQRQPLFTERISDREQFLKLREASRRSEMVRNGEIEADLETVRFDRNEDGAQQRLIELTAKFGAEAEE